MSGGGGPFVGAAVYGVREAVPGAVVRVSGAGETVPGASATVPREEAVPFSAESRHLARELLDAPQELVIVCRLANAQEHG
jgi:hypothetical protein